MNSEYKPREKDIDMSLLLLLSPINLQKDKSNQELKHGGNICVLNSNCDGNKRKRSGRGME